MVEAGIWADVPYGVPAAIDGQAGTVDLISYEEHQFGWAAGSLLRVRSPKL